MATESGEVLVAVPQSRMVMERRGGDDDIGGGDRCAFLSERCSQTGGFEPNVLCDIKPMESQEIFSKEGQGAGRGGALQDLDGDQPHRGHGALRQFFLESSFERFWPFRVVIIDPN